MFSDCPSGPERTRPPVPLDRQAMHLWISVFWIHIGFKQSSERSLLNWPKSCNGPSESYTASIFLPGIMTCGVRSAGELLISRPHCWTRVLLSCTIQLDLVGAKSLISRAALKRPKPFLTVKLARLPPVFLIIVRVQTQSLWRAGLKPCDSF